MVKQVDKKAQRMKRHIRVRGKISGTPERPRLNVFRSNANIYAQIIDDVNGVTLVIRFHAGSGFHRRCNRKQAKQRRRLAKCSLQSVRQEKGIKDTVVFDRGGYIYHGRVAALAEGAREAGLDF
jgi:large subunit ribosomal protein L18